MGVEYRCDKCLWREDTPERMNVIGVGVIPKTSTTNITTISVARIIKPQLWCNECLNGAGISTTAYQVVTEPKTTLEDLLRELIIDEIENSKGT